MVHTKHKIQTTFGEKQLFTLSVSNVFRYQSKGAETGLYKDRFVSFNLIFLILIYSSSSKKSQNKHKNIEYETISISRSIVNYDFSYEIRFNRSNELNALNSFYK